MALRKLNKSRRNAVIRHVSNFAEVCELRSLLSAVAVGSDVIDTAEVVDSKEAVEASSVDDVESTEVTEGVSDDFEFVPELAICTMFFTGDEVLSEETPEEFVDESDPSLVKYACFSTFDTTGEVEEEVPVDGLEIVDSSEDWDPSWCYCTLISDGEDVPVEAGDEEVSEPVDGDDAVKGEDSELVDEFIVDESIVDEEFVDVTTLEGWDPSWAYRGVIVDGESVSEEEYIDEEAYYFEVTLDSEPGGEIIDEEVFVDGEEEPVAVEEGEEADEATDVEYMADFEETVVDKEGNVTPIRFNIQPFFRGGLGSVEMQTMAFSSSANAASTAESTFVGPVSAGSDSAGSDLSSNSNVAVIIAPVASPVAAPVVVFAVTPPSLSIPVSQTSMLNLFENHQDLFSAGTLVASLAEAVPTTVESTETTLKSDLDLQLGDVSPSRTTDSETDLNSLEPLLDGDPEDETVTLEGEQNSVPVEAVTEQPVASTDSAPVTLVKQSGNQVAGSVVAVGRSSKERNERTVDRFMTEFAMNGFVG